MTPTAASHHPIVVDASVVVSALLDSGPEGTWASTELAHGLLVAPHLMPFEAANIIRRSAQVGDISNDAASMAHEDLLQLRVELYGYEPLAARAWELRHNTTIYDGAYVALAEMLQAPLLTLDGRLVRATGPKCKFVTPN